MSEAAVVLVFREWEIDVFGISRYRIVCQDHRTVGGKYMMADAVRPSYQTLTELSSRCMLDKCELPSSSKLDAVNFMLGPLRFQVADIVFPTDAVFVHDTINSLEIIGRAELYPSSSMGKDFQGS